MLLAIITGNSRTNYIWIHGSEKVIVTKAACSQVIVEYENLNKV